MEDELKKLLELCRDQLHCNIRTFSKLLGVEHMDAWRIQIDMKSSSELHDKLDEYLVVEPE